MPKTKRFEQCFWPPTTTLTVAVAILLEIETPPRARRTPGCTREGHQTCPPQIFEPTTTKSNAPWRGGRSSWGQSATDWLGEGPGRAGGCTAPRHWKTLRIAPNHGADGATLEPDPRPCAPFG